MEPSVIANTKELSKMWDWVADETYLTPTEKEIVTLLGRGLSRMDVCLVLEITRATLRKHIQRIRNKVAE